MNMYIFNFFESKYKNKSFVNVKKNFWIIVNYVNSQNELIN